MPALNLFSYMIINKEKAFAKINLSLKVLNKRKDGYHNLESYIIFAKIYDSISIKILKSNNKNIYIDILGPFSKKLKNNKNKNLCYKAALYFCNKYNIKSDIIIKLHKKLPISSGIGGGSADAAATLKILSKFFNINLNEMLNKSSYEISRKLGADVPACLYSKPLFMKSIGDNITNLPYTIKKIINVYNWIILVTPNTEISTKKIFFNFNSKNQNTEIFFKKQKYLNNYFINNLKFYAEQKEKSIITAQNILSNQNKIAFYGMTGSGPTCFGIFKNKKDALSAKYKIKRLKPNWWINYSSIIT